MENETRGYANVINTILTNAEGRCKGLSAEALNWRPLAQDTNSIGGLVTHMCGVANFLVYQGLTGEDVGRVRSAEFAAVVGGEDELRALVAQAKTRINTALEGCSSSLLDETMSLWKREPQTTRWVILHVIEELAQHVGHIDMTRQLWEAKA